MNGPTPHDVARSLMRNGADAGLVVAYVREELHRDPYAFHSDNARALAQIGEALTGAFRAFANATRPTAAAIAALGRAFAAQPAPRQADYVLGGPRAE